MFEGFWLVRFLGKTRLRYPTALAAITILLYGAGVALCAATGNTAQFLHEARWIVLSAFGWLNGVAVVYALKNFDAASVKAKSFSALGDGEFRRTRADISRLVTHPAYWAIVALWTLLSLYHLIGERCWWQLGASYHQPLAVDIYGFVAQVWNGCVLGGMFVYIVPIGLNLAYAKVCSLKYFRSEIATEKGIRALSGFKRLITVNTLAAAVMSVLAIAIWAQATSPYIPLAGSAFMFLPTAIVPHALFRRVLSKARRERLDALGEQIGGIASEGSEASLGSLIALHKLLREEAMTERLRPWLVDVSAAAQLLLAALVSQIVSLLIGMFA